VFLHLREMQTDTIELLEWPLILHGVDCMLLFIIKNINFGQFFSRISLDNLYLLCKMK
jgi:hypothetical protein